ncbi:hypothetical protein [Mesorhizobium sophorae]|uniref:hypothetical protein n=1 Tax=Mesorhizobium sophorae TaxID=1300294 RepID=UPI000BA4A965|nr:hypothetical protein [Mesorhizobium sophorae]
MGELIQKNLALWGGILASLVALIGTFESFTNALLFWRLLVTGVAASLILWEVAEYFAARSKPAPRKITYGEATKPSPPWGLILSGAVILAVCAAFVLLACLQTQRFIMRVDEQMAGSSVRTDLYAPLRMVEKVLIQLPAKAENICDWQDLRPGALPALFPQEIDMATPTPKLLLQDFVQPQAVRVDCKAPTSIASGIRVSPPSTEVFRTSDLRTWRLWIYIMGGLIWLSAVGRMCWLYFR